MEVQSQPARGQVLMRLTAAFTLAVFFLLGLPLLVSAAAPPVVISEIMWDGTEYIELFNTTESNIELTDWSLTRQQAGGSEKTVVSFAEEDTIAAGSYFLVEKTEAATTVAADTVAALTLVNTGELVTLRDAGSAVVEQAGQLGAWYAGENTVDGVSMERTIVDAAGTAQENWHTSTEQVGGRAGTPGEANSTPAVNHAPEATLTGPNTALVGEALTFSAEDSSDADYDELTFTWSFGDGSSAAAAEVAHAYTAAGTYTVRVTVSDGDLEDEAQLMLAVSAPVYSDAVAINEFLPDPNGSDTDNEFIEVKNTGGSAVGLAGWQLDDADGGSTPYTVPDGVTLGAGALRSFARSETKIALNNTGDTVRVLDPAGAVKASFVYGTTAAEGQSYNRQGSGYVVSTTVTAGAENVITKPKDDDEEEAAEDEEASAGRVAGESVVVVELKDIREEEVGTMIETEGVISAPPGVLGAKILYLAGSGVQVYFYAEDYPELKLGDKVKVVGELGTSLGEYRLKLAQASDIKVVSAAEKPIPHQVKTGEIDEATEGSLVIIEGSVTETSGDTFYVDDGSGEVKVFIKDTTQIDKPSMKKGTDVTITGIVSQTSSGWRILPRFQEDVRLGRVAGLTSFPATGRRAAFGGRYGLQAGLIIVLVGYVIASARRAREPLLA